MKQKSFRPSKVSTLLQSDTTLSHLGQMLNQQQRLLTQIRSILPHPLDAHCLHARISTDQLILHTDSPVWTSRLRFHAPQLLKQLQQQAPKLRRVKILVHIPARVLRPKRRKITLSPTSAASIQDLANHISDPALRAALQRLESRKKE